MPVQVSLTIEIAASASLSEMEQQVQEIGQQARRAGFKQTIRQWEDQQRAGPHCGATQRRLEGTVRRVIATLFGRVQVARRRFRCQACGRRWCPANALLAELAGGRISRPLQEAAWLAGCSWPYRAASATLKRLSGAEISAEEMRRRLNRQGTLRAAQQQAEASRVCTDPMQPGAAVQEEDQRVLVGIDGGWVGSREQRGGMEGKVAVVCAQVVDLPKPTFSRTFSWSQRGPRHPPRQRHRLLKRRYVGTFGPAEHLGTWAEAAARSVSDQVRRPVVLLADGAQWLKKEQARHFREATCILDWAHLWREVRHAIDAAARATPLTQRQGDYQVYLHRTWLWPGQVEQAVQGLRILASGLPAEAREVLTKTITYLEHQRPWIGSYERWRAQGYPVGSGMIERAVALVINRRLKKRGMPWCRPKATAVVALRTDLLNEDWILPQRLRSFP